MSACTRGDIQWAYLELLNKRSLFLQLSEEYLKDILPHHLLFCFLSKFWHT